jgi:hypothetical protein
VVIPAIIIRNLPRPTPFRPQFQYNVNDQASSPGD